jgi:hypothetical protein
MAQRRQDDQKQYSSTEPIPAPPGRRPWFRVDGCSITKRDQKGQRYRVRIEGHNLWGSIVQPLIIVGGHPLENVTFDPSGKAIEGTLPTELKDRRIVVDYGFARHEGEVEPPEG